MNVQMVAPRVPLADANGYVTREWYRLLSALYADSPSTREMASQFVRLADQTLGAAASPVYIAPAGIRTVIRAAVVANSTGGAVNVSLWLVPAGETPGAGNVVLSSTSVGSNNSRVCLELVDQVIEPGGALYALGSGLTLVASGLEYR
jgi:hypothetical protein